MECPSCQFNNMPGAARCLRCGGALQLAAAAISVEPPRASAGRKWLRRWFDSRRWWLRARDAASGAGRNLADEVTRETVIGRLDLGVVLRSLVPGWAHWHAGFRLRGAIFALLYWPTLVALLATVGTPWGATWLGILLAIHASSVIDLLIARDQSRFERFVSVPIFAVGIIACLYVPAGYWLTSHVFVRRMTQPVGSFGAGDVVWFRYPAPGGGNVQPGDVVLYDIGNRTIPLGSHRAFAVGGERIERVIAGPGSQVHWHDGHFDVDGQPTDLRPFGDGRSPEDWNITVPVGSFCIVPSTVLVPIGPNDAPNYGVFWTNAALVRAGNIRGRAWIVGYPPIHWAWLW